MRENFVEQVNREIVPSGSPFVFNPESITLLRRRHIARMLALTQSRKSLGCLMELLAEKIQVSSLSRLFTTHENAASSPAFMTTTRSAHTFDARLSESAVGKDFVFLSIAPCW